MIDPCPHSHTHSHTHNITSQQKVNGPILEALAHIVEGAKRQALEARALGLVRHTLQLHMRHVYSALGAAGAKGAMRFLVAAASLGPTAAQELLQNFNFSHPVSWSFFGAVYMMLFVGGLKHDLTGCWCCSRWLESPVNVVLNR